MKKSYEVRILGQNLSVLHGSGDEYVMDVIRYVTDKVRDVEQAATGLNAASIAILAALNIADDYFRLKESRDNIYQQMEIKSENLIKLINGINKVENPCDVRD